MTTKSAIALAALLVAAGTTAGCDHGTPAGGGPAAVAGNVLRCGSVVDAAGYNRGPLTTDLAVAFLTGTRLAGGAATVSSGPPGAPPGGPQAGPPGGADTSTLDTMAVELMGYSGSRLSDDAQAFAVAELNYNPGGPVDASYAGPLARDILALQRDCPDGLRLGLLWRQGG
jgi:hypothetical protein